MARKIWLKTSMKCLMLVLLVLRRNPAAMPMGTSRCYSQRFILMIMKVATPHHSFCSDVLLTSE